MVFDVGKCHILPNAQQIRYLGASYLLDYELKLQQLLQTYATKQSTFIEEHDDNIIWLNLVRCRFFSLHSYTIHGIYQSCIFDTYIVTKNRAHTISFAKAQKLS